MTSSVHSDPAANGTSFGTARITVDTALGDAVLRVNAPGHRTKRVHHHSLDEIQSAYIAARGARATDTVAQDVADALEFAATSIKQAQEA